MLIISFVFPLKLLLLVCSIIAITVTPTIISNIKMITLGDNFS